MQYFIHCFPHLHGLTCPREVESLQGDFLSYQLLSDTDISSKVWKEAKVNEEEDVYFRTDAVWNHLCKVLFQGIIYFFKIAQLGSVA